MVECRYPVVSDPLVSLTSPLKPKYIYGSQVRYHCDPGYHQLGSVKRRCIGADHWSGHQPQCKSTLTAISHFSLSLRTRLNLIELCSDPGISIDSSRSRDIHGPFYEGNQIFYRCDTGTRLVGERRLTCQSNGTWTSNIPSCPSIVLTVVQKGQS